jgi:MFS family permease
MVMIAADGLSGRSHKADQDAIDARALKRRNLTLALLTLTYFFSYMDRQILAILQELIRKDLDLSDTQLGLLSGFAFAIFYATLGIPVARLADRWHRGKIIAISLSIWSAMTVLCGTAANFVQLLMFRIGVGIGEAGSSPASHSIIADLYAPNERAGAMGIFSLGVVLGAPVGTFVGGTVAHYYGWRVAMYTVGFPGLLLALLVWFLVSESRRGLSESGSTRPIATAQEQVPAQPKLSQGFKSILNSRLALHLVAAFTLTSTVGYGMTAWGPSYMQRSLDLSLLEVSLWVAPLSAVAGTLSAVFGGKLANILAKSHGLYAQSWMVCVTKLIALPFALAFYLVDQPTIAIGCYLAALLFQNTYLGVTFALIQGEAPVHMRALWAAIALLINNLIGLGLGPTLVGWVSDLLQPHYGDNSLRYALCLLCLVGPWGIYHYWRAGIHLRRSASAKS